VQYARRYASSQNTKWAIKPGPGAERGAFAVHQGLPDRPLSTPLQTRPVPSATVARSRATLRLCPGADSQSP
jgi:hypothetical protein